MKYKGKKFWGIMNSRGDFISSVNDDLNFTKDHMEKDDKVLVELTVTKVFTRETDIQEIEKE